MPSNGWGQEVYDKSWRNAMPDVVTMLNSGEPGLARAFLFEVDNVEIGIFKEVKGLEMTVATVDIPEGGQNGFTHKAIGKTTWTNITLRRGVTRSDALFDWVQKSSGVGYAGNGNKLSRSTAAITALTATGKRLRAWNVLGAFAVKWKGPEFSADATTILEEELEIAHHGFTSETFSGLDG